MEIIPTIDLLAERIKPPKSRLLISDYHVCNRNMWFNYRNVKPIKYDVRKSLFAETLKPTVKHWIKTASNCAIHFEDSVLSNGQKLDGIIEKDGFKLLCVFIYSSNSFKRAEKHGLNHSDEMQIIENLDLSIELSTKGNKLDEALCFIVNRDTFDMFEITIKRNEESLKASRGFINDVIASEEVPPASEAHHCNWCDYKEFCNNNELALVNCGTCANYSAKMGCIFGSSTCEKHLYHPQLMEFIGHTFVAADEQRLRIEYDTFVNVTEGDNVSGKASFSSKEIYKASGAELLEDPVLINLMAEFDGRLLCN